ncbi:HlyC/CorC family transporter [Aestuariirhabdus sp. Z084]|uniref:HlyC/CorC family transporter n=1 Tax=Aestuariirhabdus haliotis TaxID=2918751 RepID=UPI00201B371E|nr:HlyC/CorC family transporter [Aestuariirhabdus haliotis]MCL6415865.1 HlyC/CorC family transporter [Aestuariirhabdus haliotis]MCL6419833.1 HlyC/CorC family transporter [Aestuariirhabdus haliotis]
MNDIPLGYLFATLGLLILSSAFFSSSETGMMALNRYRLKHLAQKGHSGAQRASRLLERPDRLIGIILIGNNFVNIFASVIATVIAVRLWGDAGIAIATGALTLVILIFAEVTPKTLAALHPERIAFPASILLTPLLWLLYPAVWLVNIITNGLLRVLGVNPEATTEHHLNADELRTVVHESKQKLPRKRQGMLLNILDLEKVSVDHIMIPRNEINGIDIEDDLAVIVEQLRASQHTRMPIFKGDINNLIGLLHMRNFSRFLIREEQSKAALLQEAKDPYFVPENTPLHTQMFNFQKEKQRLGFVVDEYGDVQGMITLDDILEEIVGEFTTDVADINQDITPRSDGSFHIDGTATIREINKTLNWELPVDGPKTLNGLIVERLESIPETNICLSIGEYRIETVLIKDNMIKTANLNHFDPSHR